MFSTLTWESFHTLSNHSPHTYNLLNHPDHLGIVMLMYTAGISMIYFLFPPKSPYDGDAKLRVIYWILMTFSAASCATATFIPQFRMPKYHILKIAAYTSLGLVGVVFIVHGILKYGWEVQNCRLSLALTGGMAGANFWVQRFLLSE